MWPSCWDEPALLGSVFILQHCLWDKHTLSVPTKSLFLPRRCPFSHSKLKGQAHLWRVDQCKAEVTEMFDQLCLRFDSRDD